MSYKQNVHLVTLLLCFVANHSYAMKKEISPSSTKMKPIICPARKDCKTALMESAAMVFSTIEPRQGIAYAEVTLFVGDPRMEEELVTNYYKLQVGAMKEKFPLLTDAIEKGTLFQIHLLSNRPDNLSLAAFIKVVRTTIPGIYRINVKWPGSKNKDNKSAFGDYHII
jgi:hypothetical protein